MNEDLPNNGSWNYRIVRYNNPTGKDGYYRLHECYCDAGGKVILWDDKPSPFGERMLADAKRSKDAS
jgi:hypothetical protein